jgi:hypothetical protein
MREHPIERVRGTQRDGHGDAKPQDRSRRRLAPTVLVGRYCGVRRRIVLLGDQFLDTSDKGIVHRAGPPGC